MCTCSIRVKLDGRHKAVLSGDVNELLRVHLIPQARQRTLDETHRYRYKHHNDIDSDCTLSDRLLR